jgi:hypothetical protein
MFFLFHEGYAGSTGLEEGIVTVSGVCESWDEVRFGSVLKNSNQAENESIRG